MSGVSVATPRADEGSATKRELLFSNTATAPEAEAHADAMGEANESECWYIGGGTTD